MNGLVKESARAKSCEQALRYVSDAMSEDVYLQINNAPFELHVALKDGYGHVFRSEVEWVAGNIAGLPERAVISFWDGTNSLKLGDDVQAISEFAGEACTVFEGTVEWLSEDNTEVKLKGHKLLDVSYKYDLPHNTRQHMRLVG